MVSLRDAPSLSAYGDDPEYLAAAKASSELLGRIKGRDATRDERRLLGRYSRQMDAAAERARETHQAFLRDHGLLTHE